MPGRTDVVKTLLAKHFEVESKPMRAAKPDKIGEIVTTSRRRSEIVLKISNNHSGQRARDRGASRGCLLPPSGPDDFLMSHSFKKFPESARNRRAPPQPGAPPSFHPARPARPVKFNTRGAQVQILARPGPLAGLSIHSGADGISLS